MIIAIKPAEKPQRSSNNRAACLISHSRTTNAAAVFPAVSGHLDPSVRAQFPFLFLIWSVKPHLPLDLIVMEEDAPTKTFPTAFPLFPCCFWAPFMDG